MAKKVHVNSELLRAVIGDPEDIGSRLVYADWLEEQADPQAQFIRIQCELATADPRSSRISDLEYDEELLLRKHRTNWSKPLRAYSSKVEFKLGLPGAVTMNAATFLEHDKTLMALAPIIEFRLTSPHKVIDELAACKSLSGIHTLNIRDGKLGLARLKVLLASKHLAGLRGIDIGYNGLKASSMKALAESQALPNLRMLKLESCGITLETLGQLLDSGIMSQLETLSLGNNGLDDECLFLLAETNNLGPLRWLELEFNSRMSAAGLERLMQSKNTRKLRHFSLRRCELNASVLQSLVQAKLPDLVSLDLSANRLDGALRNVAKSKCFSGLTSLSLADGNIADSHFSKLLSANPMRYLRCLDLSGNQEVREKSIELLANRSATETLTRLNLLGARPGERGLKAIAESDHFRNLQELRVCDNTDRGLEALIAASHLDRILVIEVGGKSGGKVRLSDATKAKLTQRFGSKACRFTYWWG